jgi:hypothetical protein
MVVASPSHGRRQVAWTGDRTEFLEHNGALDHPAALDTRAPLSNRVGAGRAGVEMGMQEQGVPERPRLSLTSGTIFENTKYPRYDEYSNPLTAGYSPTILRCERPPHLPQDSTSQEPSRLRAARLAQLRSRGLAPGRDGGQGAFRPLGQRD